MPEEVKRSEKFWGTFSMVLAYIFIAMLIGLIIARLTVWQ